VGVRHGKVRTADAIPGEMDIKGAYESATLPDNVLSVWRNKEKGN